MSDLAEKSAWVNHMLTDGARGLQAEGLPWLQACRDDAVNKLSLVEFPNRKQERWRYTPTDALMKQDFSPVHRIIDELEVDDTSRWFTPGLDAYRLVFINGQFHPSCSEVQGLPDGTRIGSLRGAMLTDEALIKGHLGTIQHPERELFELLNQAMISDGLFVHLTTGVTLDRPLEVVYIGDAGGSSVLSQPRGLVILEEGAKAVIVERFVGQDNALYFNNTQTEIMLGKDAGLQHYRVQDESAGAFHMSGLHLIQHESSHYDSAVFSLGAGLARTEIYTRFAGERARTNLQGLYLVGDGQINDVHLDIAHNLPNCESEESYKGLLYGKGRAVFDGRILVAKDAQKTEAHLSNNNLMLTRNSEVDTKPQLEIYADDVKCSHGTTVGQIEEEQVFYMRSRGIREETARAMLSMGFAGAIVDKVGLEPLREDLMSRIQARVSKSLIQAA